MSTCRADRALPVLGDRFTCTRLAGTPTLSEADCAARWLRARRPRAEDPGRPASFDTCARCADGARRNGREAPAPVVPRPQKEDVGAIRRDLLAREVRARGTASLADLAAAVRAAGLDAPLSLRQSMRACRRALDVLLRECRVRRLAKGLYGTRRAQAPVTRWALAVAWVAQQAGPWSPAELGEAVAPTLVDSRRPRQRVHKLLRRLIAEGEVVRMGLGRYAVPEVAGEPAQLDLGLVVAPPARKARRTPLRKSLRAVEPAQLSLFAA